MRSFAVGVLISVIFIIQAYGSELYVKRDIVEARYGNAERQQLLYNAYNLESLINSQIIGQNRIAKVVQARVVQYLENFGSRQNEPVALHILGLPGVGKSAILGVLEKIGMAVYKVDMQEHVSDDPRVVQDTVYRLKRFIEQAGNKPMVILFDELDKVPEVSVKNGMLEEKTRPIIGLINQLLNDGKSKNGDTRDPLDVSNCLIVSAMNFPAEIVGEFAKDALGSEKSFYDFTIEDFGAMNEWLSHGPSGRSKLLARMFRSNTVSRLVPNTVIAKSLEAGDYRSIIQLYAQIAIKNSTEGSQSKRRVTAEVTDAFIDFLNEVSVYAPSGARETVFRVNALTEQLINFGIKAQDPQGSTLDRPRSLVLDYDSVSKKVLLTVQPKFQKGRGTVPGESFLLQIDYDDDSRAFITPKELAVSPPPTKAAPQPKTDKPISIKEIREARFPKTQKSLNGMAEKLDGIVIGQKITTQFLEKEFRSFLGKADPAPKGPPFTVIAGFPGIGKSMLAEELALHLNLPTVRINMQAHSSSEADAAKEFIAELEYKVREVKAKDPNRKFILLIEELDKVSEIDPSTGRIINRPVMTYIKDLLNSGFLDVTLKTPYGADHRFVDVRSAYGLVTMNFGIDRFGFKADPRLTTTEDMERAWKRLNSTPADVKGLLGSLFLPETVSRIMPYFKIMPPLMRKDYEVIIDMQVAAVIQERLIDRKTGRNRGQIAIQLTDEYKRYLYSETVIPSEGPRNTVTVTKNRILTDLEAALKAIPKSSPLATKPITIVLDFVPDLSSVVASMLPQDNQTQVPAQQILQRRVELTFPPIEARGLMSETRLLVALHEFGHAFAAIRNGARFEYAAAVSPQQGTGGYVKFKAGSDIPTAKRLLAQLYSTLASRAMERVFMGKDPKEARSSFAITNGSSNDNLQATQSLFNLIYEFGLDPFGGVIERMGIQGMSRYANFADLPPETVEKLGLLMRDLENYLVDDFLRAHPKDWYVEKIAEFARVGGLTEKEFYDLIKYPHPGDNSLHMGETTRLGETFKGKVQLLTKEAAEAKSFPQGDTQTTAEQNLQRGTEYFLKAVMKRLHPGQRKKAVSIASPRGISNLCEELFI